MGGGVMRELIAVTCTDLAALVTGCESLDSALDQQGLAAEGDQERIERRLLIERMRALLRENGVQV